MLDSRRGLYVAIGSGVAALGAAGGLGTAAFVNRPRLTAPSPAPGAAVAASRVPVSVAVAHPGSLDGLRVTVDGRDLTDAIRAGNGRLIVVPPKLADGPHTATVRFTSGNLFARTVSRTWSFDVDTRIPDLALRTPGAPLVNRRAVQVSGSAEPGAVVEATWTGGGRKAVAGPGGAWRLTARLREGGNSLRVAARDRAGNARVLRRSVDVDTRAPRVVIDPIPGGVLRSSHPVITGRVIGESPRALTFGGLVNGDRIPDVNGASALPIAGSSSGVDEPALDGTTGLAVTGSRFRVTLPSIGEGRNRLRVWAADAAGNRGGRQLAAVVDSTEDFGDQPLLPGARGADVRALQLRLKEAGLLRGARPNGRFDQRTFRAVRGYQRKFDLRVTGEVNAPTLRKLVGRIVVSIGQRKLRLIRNGHVVRTYRVAVGQPAYPTPLGTYKIVQKQKDPSWIPPSSPWAKGLGPIPPGPGNPLGTRWIGTSAPAVGIHGTYADSSIGSAASHGCIRMHIPEVEALYDEVSVGMPVTFVA